MYCNTCQDNPCSCRSLVPSGNATEWLLQQCSELGCSVVIRSRIGQQERVPVCTWHVSNTAYASRDILTRHASGPAMSKEEFGIDLFDAIQAQAGLRQAERTADVYTFKGLTRQANEAQDQVKKLQHALSTILDRNTIAPEDLKRILEIA
jgi:hypothetical protein